MQRLSRKTENCGRSDWGFAAPKEERSFYAFVRRRWAGVFLSIFLLLLLVCNLWASSCRGADPNPASPETIVELQEFRETTSIRITGPGGMAGRATFINLNPNINVWFLTELDGQRGSPPEAYHLENANPRTQKLLRITAILMVSSSLTGKTSIYVTSGEPNPAKT